MCGHEVFHVVDSAAVGSFESGVEVVVEASEDAVPESGVLLHGLHEAHCRRPGSDHHHTGEVVAAASVALEDVMPQQHDHEHRRGEHGIIHGVDSGGEVDMHHGHQREKSRGVDEHVEKCVAHYPLHGYCTAFVRSDLGEPYRRQVCHVDTQPGFPQFGGGYVDFGKYAQYDKEHDVHQDDAADVEQGGNETSTSGVSFV